MSKLKSFLSALVLGVAAQTIAAATADAKDIVVGTSVALTGKYARTGQEQLQGFEMWVDEVNARGGLLGRKVRLVHYDDESKPETGAKLYEKLITDDKVDLLIGPYSSDVTMAASTVAEKHGMPMVSSGASASEIWERGYKNIFGLYTPANTYMDQILEFAKSKGLRRVALIYENTAFPIDVGNGVKAAAKRLGMEVVFEEEYGMAIGLGSPTDRDWLPCNSCWESSYRGGGRPIHTIQRKKQEKWNEERICFIAGRPFSRRVLRWCCRPRPAEIRQYQLAYGLAERGRSIGGRQGARRRSWKRDRHELQ